MMAASGPGIISIHDEALQTIAEQEASQVPLTVSAFRCFPFLVIHANVPTRNLYLKPRQLPTIQAVHIPAWKSGCLEMIK